MSQSDHICKLLTHPRLKPDLLFGELEILQPALPTTIWWVGEFSLTNIFFLQFILYNHCITMKVE